MNLKLIIAQVNFLVGDIEGNTQRVIDAIKTAEKENQADLIIFPEMTLTAYPAKDLWLRTTTEDRVQHALKRILTLKSAIGIILGYPKQTGSRLYNEAAFIQHGKIILTYQKQYLPNYNVFNEFRYFSPGEKPVGFFQIKGHRVGLIICEDLWYPKPAQQAAQAGAELLISINASPFTYQKHEQRLALIQQQSKKNHLPILYVNSVGGQDDLIFDGGSLATNAQGKVIYQAPSFQEIWSEVCLSKASTPLSISPPAPLLERIYEALVLGTRDYIKKNHFSGALIGLSGGIDSALTLAIAVKAIGKSRVKTIMMPSRFTSPLSLEYAKRQAALLGVTHEEISIEPLLTEAIKSLKTPETGITAENLQARCRGMLLMAQSNQSDSIVLSCGNKSEMAVGYTTLYGDMVGGLSVLKDVYKTQVYQLAEFLNQQLPTILPDIIQRTPSAELAPNQKDQDTLPPYEVLDQILFHYIEENRSPEAIMQQGFEKKTVETIIRKLHLSEYKRQQAPIGIKVSPLAFGSGWCYPVTKNVMA